jgi:AraC-like DNA-binding protein
MSATLPGHGSDPIERFGQVMAPERDPVQSFRERLPAPETARKVASVWVLEVGAEGGAYEHRTVPNGSAEISYALGSNRIVVSGPQRMPVVARVEPGTTVVGLRFHPGAAPSILGPPASDLVDLRVDLDRLWGSSVAMLAERLGEAGAPEGAARLLEDEVAHRLADAAAPDQLVKAAIGRLQPWRPGGLGDLASGLHISPRQLHRRFVAALGFGPKTLERILRFQGFLALAQGPEQRHIGLARLAQRAGYADQPHLTREAAALTGLTPRAFLDETWRRCGPTHDHEASYAGLRRALLAAR